MDSSVIVEIKDGKIKGQISENYWGGLFYSFLGIPYAKPPVGERRFKAPVPVDPWSGVLDATQEGPECPSKHLIFQCFVGNENNCLHLNVYTKEFRNIQKCAKPVMVWIHGGGFTSGSNKREFFGPDFLMTEDIVLVTINYRTGAFGFLSLEDSSLGVPGNAGLKDMVLALQWVQQNSERFGGNSSNVTIFGESAGAAACHYLILSPLSKGLFHKAIIQSGCAICPWAQGVSNGKYLAEKLRSDRKNEAQLLEELQTLPADKIVEAQSITEFFTAQTIRPFGPVIEQESTGNPFIAKNLEDILKNGDFNSVPLMIGNTSNEGILFDIYLKTQPEVKKYIGNFEVEIPKNFKIKKESAELKEAASEIEAFYKEGNCVDDWLRALKSDASFIHATHRSIQLQKKHSTTPIYVYNVSLETPRNYFKTIFTVKSFAFFMLLYKLVFKLGKCFLSNFLLKLTTFLPTEKVTGVCHADELGYLFSSFTDRHFETGSIEEISIRRFVKLWTNFAKTGNPTPDKDPLLDNVIWEAITNDNHYYLDIGKSLHIDVNPYCERMEFWDNFYEKYGN